VAVTDVESTGDTEATSGALLWLEICLTSAMVRLAFCDWVPVEDGTPEPNLPVLNTVNVLVPRASMRCLDRPGRARSHGHQDDDG
jgi:hypothetical protein